MKQILNEVKRMQELAGIIKEDYSPDWYSPLDTDGREDMDNPNINSRKMDILDLDNHPDVTPDVIRDYIKRALKQGIEVEIADDEYDRNVVVGWRGRGVETEDGTIIDYQDILPSSILVDGNPVEVEDFIKE